MSPSIDYVQQVLLPMLALAGLPPIEAELHRRGWMWGNRGTVTFKVPALPRGVPLPAFKLAGPRGPIVEITATALGPAAVRDVLKKELAKALRGAFHTLSKDGGITIAFEAIDGSGGGGGGGGGRQRQRREGLYLLLVAHAAGGARLGRDWLYDGRPGPLEAEARQMVKRFDGAPDRGR
ncbi:hypothetical protein HK405_002314 [Cladochytrium tenue]|nr:hypothetical protein HK405_002314 [Cladochytrium tenue]